MRRTLWCVQPPGTLVESIHEASLRPAGWPEALAAMASWVAGGGSHALALVSFVEGPAPGTGWVLSSETRLPEKAYELLGRASHPLFRSAGKWPAEYVGPSDEFASPEDLAGTTLARGFFGSDGTLTGRSATLIVDDELLASVHVLRDRERDGAPWSDGAEERLRALVPSLRRALEIYVRLRRARVRSEIERAVLDRLDVATVVLDTTASVARMNPAAQRLLDARDGVLLDGTHLRAPGLPANRALQLAVRAAVEGAVSSGASAAGVVVLPRRSGRRPLVAFVMRLPETDAMVEQRPLGAVVLLRDADEHGPRVEELLQRLFDLTPAEARLAVRIAHGDSPAEAADSLGIALATARTHLKRVFFKTATSKQADLVRLVLAELPPVSMP